MQQVITVASGASAAYASSTRSNDQRWSMRRTVMVVLGASALLWGAVGYLVTLAV